jgi:hypothetical protein
MPDITAGGTYETSDLGLASLLFALGVPYHGLRTQEGTWAKLMIFDRPAVEYISGWQSGTIEVNALAFWRASRTLKHSLMSARTD